MGPDPDREDDAAHPPPWWREAVLYQVYPRSFRDADGDGNGDLEGIRAGVPYLADLGVDAVWLAPIYPSPLRDNGYDVLDHCAIHPMFGTWGAFDGLVTELRARGLRLILDFVANHTSDRHPWFEAARRSRAAARREWYLWRDPAPDGGPPNNWRSLFGGSAWELDRGSGQYYCHSFLACQPDLDWSQAPVREAMVEVLRFWLARGVAGFRIDSTGLIAKDPACADDPPNPDWVPGDPDWNRVLRTKSANGAALIDYLRELRGVVGTFPGDPVLIAETYDRAPALGRFYGTNGDGVHLAMNMGLALAEWSAPALANVISEAQSRLPPQAWPNWVLGNHDMSRVASRIGDRQARGAMLLLLTLRGTPILYAGDELGLQDVPVEGPGHDPIAAGSGLRSRDPQRSPIPWDDSPHAGFSGSRPWLPVGAENRHRNVAAQRGRPASMLEFTCAALRLRRAEAALRRGSLTDLETGAGLLAFTRSWHGRALRVILNLGSVTREAVLPFRGVVALSTDARRARGPVEKRILLAPDEAMVIAAPPTSRGPP